MSKNRKIKKNKSNNIDVWTEAQYEEYLKGLYGMDFIAGYTENGVPYGTFIDEDNEDEEIITKDSSFDSSDDTLPF
ncbi:hypothetical protein [Petrocella sp. FN5]|uniref:hypothetical protein n=1 Tax=Petrocella sp. FN5 TaxID=3032002 RepID=UPI0023DC1030|nr:hypothetical protein [Petrocella sp. FN5]MDF1618413.1 hypothetical protein [Petrocella sp. FN5]